MKKVILCALLLFPVSTKAADRYALVDDQGAVTNVIALEGGTQYAPPSGMKLVKDASGQAAQGGSYSSVFGFSPPPSPPPPAEPAPTDPMEKLKGFLARNPDVAKLLLQ